MICFVLIFFYILTSRSVNVPIRIRKRVGPIIFVIYINK